MGIDGFGILCYGRSFRISEWAKVIGGRNEEGNTTLTKFAFWRYVIDPIDVIGSLSLVEGNPTESNLLLSERITARYCDHENTLPVALSLFYEESLRSIQATPLVDDDPQLDAWRIAR